MFQVNEYFDGQVKSIAFSAEGQPATIGVMAAGEYEFGTDSIEHMTLVSGAMAVRLPGQEQWQDIAPGETFIVEAGVRFGVRLAEDSSYLCRYR